MEEKKPRKIGTSTDLKINNFNCYYGTINKKKCTGIFLGCNSYVCPNTDYKKDVDAFKWNFERFMNHYINCFFKGVETTVLYSIEDRISNLTNRNNTSFTLLPIELTILFNTEVDYNTIKDDIPCLIKVMINYLSSYQDLVFDNKIYK